MFIKDKNTGHHGSLLPFGEVRPGTNSNLISDDFTHKNCLIVKLMK